jgi:hypothetical protein
LVWASSSNARLECTNAFLSSSGSKNIYGLPRLKLKRINCDFQKPFCPRHSAEPGPACLVVGLCSPRNCTSLIRTIFDRDSDVFSHRKLGDHDVEMFFTNPSIYTGSRPIDEGSNTQLSFLHLLPYFYPSPILLLFVASLHEIQWHYKWPCWP